MNSPVTVTHPSAEMATPVAQARGPIRVMLIDDERLARQGLRELLREFADVEIVGEADTAASAVNQIPAVSPDVIFLDIRLPGGDGFSVLESLERVPLVVFVTAYSDYATQAFDVEAVDYLLKPVRRSRLEETLRRVRAELGAGDQPPYSLSDRICLRTPERTIIAPLSNLISLKAEGDFTRVSVADLAPLLICQTLGIYERTLPSPPFLRIDRSLILNLNRLSSVEISPSRGARIFVEGAEEPIPVGRTGLRRLRAALPQHLSGIPETES